MAVIVIGSGPAALSAAIRLAVQRFEVQLVTGNKNIERERPRTIPSESIHPGVISILEKLSVADVMNSCIRSTYDGIVADGVFNRIGSDEAGAWFGFHINPEIFKDFLLKKCIELGVVILNHNVNGFEKEENRVIGVSFANRESIYGDFVVDASGRKQMSARLMKFEKQFLSKPLICWTGITGGIPENSIRDIRTSFYFEGKSWNWLAPEQKGRCTWTRLARNSNADLLSPAILRQYPLVDSINTFNVRWRVIRPMVAAGLILCGDAAGILDPAASQGIYTALLSGMMAADCICAIRNEPENENILLSFYDQWFLKEFILKSKRLKEYYLSKNLDWF